MTPRYRISVTGLPTSSLVRWLQALIEVLRVVPRGFHVTVDVQPTEEDTDDGNSR